MTARDPMHPDATGARERVHGQRTAALRRARDAPRCAARTRTGSLCQAPACVGRRRCRMHGGRALAGAAHPGYVHGEATRTERRERAQLAALVRACRRTLGDLGPE